MEKSLWSTKGRIDRGMFWLRCIVAVVLGGAAFFICRDNVANNGPFPTILASVLAQVTCLAFVLIQGAKRMRDVNRNPSTFLIPIYGLLVALAPSESEAERSSDDSD